MEAYLHTFRCEDQSKSPMFLAFTGIGKSLAWRLAGQGLNVVLVALQDDHLDATFAEFQSAFPGQTIRKASATPGRLALPVTPSMRHVTSTASLLCCSCPDEPEKHLHIRLARDLSADLVRGPQVGANLGKPGYMDVIAKATEDIDVQIVFCNAGYILTGFFHTRCAACLLPHTRHHHQPQTQPLRTMPPSTSSSPGCQRLQHSEPPLTPTGRPADPPTRWRATWSAT
jgi:NAD(P)-dependent dehydrogenase (short-subunit alcohol dehydrogenase family)